MSGFIQSSYGERLFRNWHCASCLLSKECLIYPVFVSHDETVEEEIASLPGQKRYGVERLIPFLRGLVEKGLKSVILFGVVEELMKDALGVAADSPEGPIVTAVKRLRSDIPELVIACDLCLCQYTDKHTCYISDAQGNLDESKTLMRTAEIAVNYAKAGAHIIAPSSMIDGRVRVIKEALRSKGFGRTVLVMSYAAKFASCLYSPFRSAAGSGDSGTSRRGYQLPIGSRALAFRSALRDAEEGADIIMVKPGLFYLDILAELKSKLANHCLAVFQVSGEYAMLMAGVEKGVFDLKTIALETMTAFRRAGASAIITYLTPFLLEMDLQDAIL